MRIISTNRLERLISPIVASVFTAVIVGGAAVVVSAQTSDTGPIDACVHKNSGAVRIVDGADDCREIGGLARLPTNDGVLVGK